MKLLELTEAVHFDIYLEQVMELAIQHGFKKKQNVFASKHYSKICTAFINSSYGSQGYGTVAVFNVNIKTANFMNNLHDDDDLVDLDSDEIRNYFNDFLSLLTDIRSNRPPDKLSVDISGKFWSIEDTQSIETGVGEINFSKLGDITFYFDYYQRRR